MDMDKRSALRHLGALGLLAVSAGALTGCLSEKKVALQGIDVTGAQYAKDFPLKDTEGKQRSVQEFAGKVTVVFFGYAQCPDVCPTTLQEIAEAKQIMGPQGDKLQAVFVSVDPERDTPEILKAYVGNFDPQAIALTGSLEEVAAVAKDFKVFFRKVDGKTPGTYTVDHTAALYMYDPQGNLRAYHRYGTGPQALAADALMLLEEKAG